MHYGMGAELLTTILGVGVMIVHYSITISTIRPSTDLHASPRAYTKNCLKKYSTSYVPVLEVVVLL